MTQTAVRQTEQQLHALYTALIFSRPGNNNKYSQADQDHWVVKNYADPQKVEFAIAPIERELKVTVEQEADDWLDRRIKIDHPGLRRRMKRYQEVHAERWEEALAVGAEQLAKRRGKALTKLQDLKQQVEANSANLMRWVEELEKMVTELRSLGQPATYEDRYSDAIQTIKARIETYQNLYLPKIAELLCPEGNVTTAIAATQPEDEPEIREAISTGEVALQARLRELCEERAHLRKAEGRLLQNNRQDLLNETGDQVVALNAEIAAIRQQLYPENFIAEEVPEPEEPPFKPGDWVEAEPMGYAHGKTALFLIRGTVVEPHPGVDDELSGGIPIEYMLYEPDYPYGVKARAWVPIERVKKLDELALICDITKYLPPVNQSDLAELEEPESVTSEPHKPVENARGEYADGFKVGDRPQEDLPVSPTEELDESLAGKPVRFELYTAMWTGIVTGHQTKTHVEVQYSPGPNKPDAKVKIPRTDLIEIDGQYVEHPEYQEGDRVRIIDVVAHPESLVEQSATVLKVSPKVVRLQVNSGETYTFYRHMLEPVEQRENEPMVEAVSEPPKPPQLASSAMFDGDHLADFSEDHDASNLAPFPALCGQMTTDAMNAESFKLSNSTGICPDCIKVYQERRQRLLSGKNSLLIIGCSQSKDDCEAPIPAISRYTGPMYKMLAKLQESDRLPGDLSIWILSAEFGLIPYSHKIPNYDRRMSKDRAEKLRLQVRADLKALAQHPYQEIYVDLGKDYLEAIADQSTSAEAFLHELFPDVPIHFGVGGIGQRVSQVKRWIESGKPPTRVEQAITRHITQSRQHPYLCGEQEGPYYLTTLLTPWQAEAMTSICPECLPVWRSQFKQPPGLKPEVSENETEKEITASDRPTNPNDPIVKVWRQFEGTWYYVGQMGYQSKVTLRPGDITCLPEIDPNAEASITPSPEEPKPPITPEVISAPAIAETALQELKQSPRLSSVGCSVGAFKRRQVLP